MMLIHLQEFFGSNRKIVVLGQVSEVLTYTFIDFVNDRNCIRWHPLMIRWCLYLRHQSSKVYETLRDSGVLCLPSQRTVRDYSHCIKAEPGFSVEVDRQIYQAASMASCPPWHKVVSLLLDEMHIKESLVFNKHDGRMVGFIDLGDVNNHLLEFERSVEKGDDTLPVLANSMMVFMVKGIFTELRFAYAHFPCTSICGEQLFHPFWQAVFRLERMEFKVSNWSLFSNVIFPFCRS